MKTLLFGGALIGALCGLPEGAQAQFGLYGPSQATCYGYGPGYCPAYQPYPVPPSVHYHPFYHQTGTHWNPQLGWHTDGHIDPIPHFVPGGYGPYFGGNPHFGHQH
jgi:hypothetical protein